MCPEFGRSMEFTLWPAGGSLTSHRADMCIVFVHYYFSQIQNSNKVAKVVDSGMMIRFSRWRFISTTLSQAGECGMKE